MKLSKGLGRIVARAHFLRIGDWRDTTTTSTPSDDLRVGGAVEVCYRIYKTEEGQELYGLVLKDLVDASFFDPLKRLLSIEHLQIARSSRLF